MKFIHALLLTFLFATGVFFIAPDQQANAASSKSTAIQKAKKEFLASHPYYKNKNYLTIYSKSKNGDEQVEFRTDSKPFSHFISTYLFKNKYGQNRLYKMNMIEADFELVKIYSLSAGKNSKALSNQKASALLSKIKTLGKQGKTMKTKNLKVGTSTKNVKKQLGKPKKVTIPYTNVVYNYTNSKVYLDSVLGSKKWIVDTTGYTRMIQITQPKNQFLTYGQIKKKFGKSKLAYDRSLGLHYIRYNFGSYSINFASSRYGAFKDQSSVKAIELNDQLKFNSYFVVSTKR